MPSKEQKKRTKREQNLENWILDQEKLSEEKEWENGTNKRSLAKRQDKSDKQAEKIRKKNERKEILDEEEDGIIKQPNVSD
jgi:hypothetical protein